ncbi:MAG TPA: protein phosphatase 2C domain-containing protein, partial [Polyangiaceae bacterium]|nr:protein phosphatase 2C domain-containing protein [Polyangiaceae bacterium]
MLRSSLGVAVDYAEKSHPGLDPSKQLNEDSCGASETPLGLLAVLCDGMGGHSAGEVASKLAVQTVLDCIAQGAPDTDPSKALYAALEKANDAVCSIARGGPQVARPGSTCVSALVGVNGLRIAHVGDSRGYLVRGGQIQRCTRDHSVVGELVAAGAITPEQAAVHPNAHHITRALGMHPKVVADVSAPLEPVPGDLVILCSDGLTDLVTDPEILSAATSTGDAQGVCENLVNLALERGGHDNVTVQCLKVLEVSDTAPTIVDTVLDSERVDEHPPTIVDHSPPTERPKVAPTMVDHADHPERATPIASFLPAEALGDRKPSQSLPPDD